MKIFYFLFSKIIFYYSHILLDFIFISLVSFANSMIERIYKKVYLYLSFAILCIDFFTIFALCSLSLAA